MRHTMWFLLAIIHCLLPPVQQVWAHGVVLKASRAHFEVWTVEARFTDGTPMSYAEVEVLSPRLSHPYQKGFSDKNGRFSFVPDLPGTWQIIFKDGMGHRGSYTISVKKDKIAEASEQNHPSDISKALLLGFFAILGIFYALGYLKKSFKKPIK